MNNAVSNEVQNGTISTTEEILEESILLSDSDAIRFLAMSETLEQLSPLLQVVINIGDKTVVVDVNCTEEEAASTIFSEAKRFRNNGFQTQKLLNDDILVFQKNSKKIYGMITTEPMDQKAQKSSSECDFQVYFEPHYKFTFSDEKIARRFIRETSVFVEKLISEIAPNQSNDMDMILEGYTSNSASSPEMIAVFSSTSGWKALDS
jgi:hypothetical protein